MTIFPSLWVAVLAYSHCPSVTVSPFTFKRFMVWMIKFVFVSKLDALVFVGREVARGSLCRTRTGPQVS